MVAALLALTTLLLRGAAMAADPPPGAYRNLDPGVAYVGDEACAGCHTREARDYPGTAMGRSLSLPARDKLGLPPEGISFLNERSDTRYRVFMQEGSLKHSVTSLDGLGREIFTDTRTISWVLGSGDRGQTFLIRRGSRLYQSAIAYRPHRDGWGMAAGFESAPQYPFARPVAGPCLFCHSNRAAYVDGTINEYEDPVFHGLAIGCERCHGPGELHVRERRRLPPGGSGIDTTILNPRRLPAALRDSVCFQCHLQGDARALKAGRKVFDFRPGLPLSDHFAVFHARQQAGRGAAEGIEVVSHVERLRQSRCWTASEGQITCLTCHDPHRTPKGGEAARQFRDACLTCHEIDGCRLTEMTRGSDGDPEDCTRCHMPKMPPADAPHTLFTDHRIVRRASPAATPPASDGGDLRLANYLEGDRGSRRDLGVGYLLYSAKVGEPRYAERAASILEPLLPALRNDVNANRLMAEYYRNSGRDREAAAVLDTLVTIAPHVAEFRAELARARERLGRDAEALSLVRRAIQEDPDYAPARLILGDLLLEEGRATEAEAEHRAAVRLDPGLPQAHSRLGDSALRRKDDEEALRSYRIALALDPALLSPRLGLAQVHLNKGEDGAALAEMRRALELAHDNPSRASVGFQLARVLARLGRKVEALEELERVLAASPDHAEARALMQSLRDR